MQAQKNNDYLLPVFPKGEFMLPMNLPLNLSGNFCETRKAHFHTGIDIKTNEREGEPVFAVENGYVSRIAVSPVGYGNALYITHPNGYTTVYGHLKSFNEAIAELVRKEQYKKKSFPVDITLPKDSIKVTKGMQIALSGNSGGSGGPHLHFEIRDAKERPLNPLLFGYTLQDDVSPIANAIEIFGLTDKDFQPATRIALKKAGYAYQPDERLIKVNDSKVGIAVNTFDRYTNSKNSIGVYSISLKDNGRKIFMYKNDRISFDEKRMIIAHLDYPIFLNEGGAAFHKCFIEPGNRMKSYPMLFNNGMIDLSDDAKHYIEIEIEDFNQNKSVVSFVLIRDYESDFFEKSSKPFQKIIYTDSLNEINARFFSCTIPGKSLVKNTLLNFSESDAAFPNAVSKVISLNKSFEHLLDYYTLSIKTEIADNEREKALIVWVDEKGKTVAKGGRFNNDFVTASVREFGKFFVALDTIPPVIKAQNISPFSSAGTANRKWCFNISDNLSGIDTYDAYIDSDWALAEYDAKFDKLCAIIPQNLGSGEHLLTILVRDERKNQTEFTTKFNQ